MTNVLFGSQIRSNCLSIWYDSTSSNMGFSEIYLTMMNYLGLAGHIFLARSHSAFSDVTSQNCLSVNFSESSQLEKSQSQVYWSMKSDVLRWWFILVRRFLSVEQLCLVWMLEYLEQVCCCPMLFQLIDLRLGVGQWGARRSCGHSFLGRSMV